MSNNEDMQKIGSSPSRGTNRNLVFSNLQDRSPRLVQNLCEKVMGFRPGSGIMLPVEVVKRPMRTVICVLAAALLAGGIPFRGEAKSYSSGGGHSYSSHSSTFGGSHSSGFGASHSSSSGSGHSFSSGGSHSSSGESTRSSSFSSTSKDFRSSSGKSYNSGSTWSDNGRHSYASAKSYSSGAGHTFASTFGNDSGATATQSALKAKPVSSEDRFTFDTAAAQARKEEASKVRFTRSKESQLPPSATPSDAPWSTAPSGSPRSTPSTPSYRVRSPPLSAPAGNSYRPVVYVPDAGTLSSRPVRIYNVFNPYSSRPWVTYQDPYNSLFWWWLLDRSLDDRAWWAYHHRYDMDPARYQALVANDQQLEARVEQLEAQQAPRDPNYAPPGVDRDLMYSDRYVEQAYSNRPTTMGAVAFWLLAVPTALGVTGFFIWLIWFKRWQTAT